MTHRCFAPTVFFLLCSVSLAQDATLRRQSFDSDPKWESFKNHLIPSPIPITKQDFGWSATNFAKGNAGGEIGGQVQRSTTPAFYGTPIAPKTLNDKLSASGRFSVTKDNGGSNLMFGWYNQTSRGWRTPNSLTMRLDGNGGKYWVFFEYGTQHWLSGGMGCFDGERYQTTKTKPFLADGTPHDWLLEYDPNGAGGKGLITLTLDGTKYELPLMEGHKADGATFDRFGLFNVQTTGSWITAYFDDLVVDGKPLDLTNDPKWEAMGNREEFQDKVIRPFHDFGYSATNYAGGKKGELGGIVWRNEEPAYYADTIGPVTLNDKLHVSGKMAFTGAGSDSGVFFGYFNSEAKRNKTVPLHVEPDKGMLAIMIEGPSRIGHYFRPAYYTQTGKGQLKGDGPLIRPDGKVHTFSTDYDPAGAGGLGQITVKFDDNVQTFDLRQGEKAEGATFDRFGLFDCQSGGHHVKIWFDDLEYTAKAGK